SLLLEAADVGVRGVAVRRVVVLGDAAEPDHTAVVHRDGRHRARLGAGRDLAAQRDEVDGRDVLQVLARVAVALRRALVVVERDAGRDHVHQREALVRERGLEDGHEVRLRSEEHTSELQSRENLVCRLLLEKKKNKTTREYTNPDKKL